MPCHQNPLSYLNDIKHKELELLTKFIYLGQCQVRHEDIGTFWTACTDLEVTGLMEDIDTDYVTEPNMVNTTEQETSQNLKHSDNRIEYT